MRGRVIDDIETRAAVDVLGPRAGMDQVTPGACGDIAAARAGVNDVVSATGGNDIKTVATPHDIVAVAGNDGIAPIARPEDLIQTVADEQIILGRAVQLAAVTVEHRAFDEPDSLEPAVVSDAISDPNRPGVARIETHDDVLLAVRGNDLRGAVIDRVDADEMQVDIRRSEEHTSELQ